MAVPGRDNGLRAQAYAPLATLDPRVVDAVLEALRDTGVAAYVVPVGGENGGYLGTHVPGRPTDRLYVDIGATEPAWRVLRNYLPSRDIERESSSAERDLPHNLQGNLPGTPGGPSSDPREDPWVAESGMPGTDEGGARHEDRGARRDEETVWQEIIAAYDSEPPDPVPPWPASEDLTSDEKAQEERESRGFSGAESRGARSSRRSAAEPENESERGSEEGGEEEHFVPPTPPPLPRPDPVNGVSWLGLFGGPTYLLVSTVIGWSVPGWAAFLAVAAFIGGFVTLVIRMGDEPPPDSGSDDGAIV